jgi:hypothetical protein
MSGKWYDLDKAADIIGITSDAVRKRIERGTLEGTKENGRWQVYVEDSRPDNSGQIPDHVNKYIKSLEEQIDYLKQENYQKNVIIRELSQKVPELPAGRPRVSFWSRFFNT